MATKTIAGVSYEIFPSFSGTSYLLFIYKDKNSSQPVHSDRADSKKDAEFKVIKFIVNNPLIFKKC